MPQNTLFSMQFSQIEGDVRTWRSRKLQGALARTSSNRSEPLQAPGRSAGSHRRRRHPSERHRRAPAAVQPAPEVLTQEAPPSAPLPAVLELKPPGLSSSEAGSTALLAYTVHLVFHDFHSCGLL